MSAKCQGESLSHTKLYIALLLATKAKIPHVRNANMTTSTNDVILGDQCSFPLREACATLRKSCV